MAITIDLSSLGDGTYTIEDDGIPGNGISVVRDPEGNIVATFAHPADSLTVLSRTGQSLNINITDSLTTADFTVGSLTNTALRPDTIQIGGVLTSGTVTLTANGAISEWGSDGATDIVAGELFLDAGAGVGAGNAIETQVSVLEAESTTGGITLSNINDLTIGGAGGTGELRGLFTGTSGDITIVNQGSITLSDNSGVESIRSAGDVNLTAIGAAADISSNVNRDAISAVGNINLSAQRDVLFGTVGSDYDNDVRAGGSIAITAGRDFAIDGFSDMAADDMGLATNGGISIIAGRDILIEDDHGVDASIGITASGSTGSILLRTGVGGTLSLAANSSAAIQVRSGGLIIEADRLLIENDSGINASGGGVVTLTTASIGRGISLGSATDGVTTLEISDAELDRVSASTVIVGSTSTGDVNVVGAITASSYPELIIRSGDNINVNADITTSTSLSLRARDNVTQSAASFITTGTLTVFVDAADNDGTGNNSLFNGAVALTQAVINGGAQADVLSGTAFGEFINGSAGADTLTGRNGMDTLTGGADTDTFRDTAAGLDGDIITDLSVGEKIVITDANPATFTFSLSGTTLTYSGGSLTLAAPMLGHLSVSAAAGGGVQLTLVQNDVAYDFNGDSRSDILWRSSTGQLSNWLANASGNGGFAPNDANAFAQVSTNWVVAGIGDVNGDGRDDIVWRNTTTGQVSDWLANASGNGGYTANDAAALTTVSTAWVIAGVGDFNGDGKDDLVWRNTTTGQVSDWLANASGNGGFTANDAKALVTVSTSWSIVGVGDFNGDGKDDLLWRNPTTGQISNWLANASGDGGFTINDAAAMATPSTNWVVVGVGDFNGDNRDDILWRNTTTGQITTWLANASGNGGFTNNDANALANASLTWHVAAIGDYNGDNRDDILWRSNTGQLTDWLANASGNGGFTPNDANALTTVPLNWTVQAPDTLFV